MHWHKGALVLAVVGLLSLQTWAQAPSAAKEPATAGEIEQLIRLLGSSDFQEREAASKKLEAIGVPALGALRRAAGSGSDLETRRRAERLISHIENSLDGLLAAYRDHGLPLPPPQAKLVRYRESNGGIFNGKVEPASYAVAFEVAPATKTEGPCLLAGTWQWRPPWRPKTRAVAPGPEILGELAGIDELATAIQFHARGWNELANAVLQKSQKKAETSRQKQLRQMAWEYWNSQITEPAIDRAPVARHLKALMQQNSSWDTVENRAVLGSLELALVPSKAKPGSIEALIDDLVDHTRDTEDLGTFEPPDRYGRIARWGFDAVPALIEHLDDDRLTRATDLDSRKCRHLCVGDLAAGLLQDLAGEDDGSRWLFRINRETRKAEARKWWEQARKMGEEAYMLDNVLPLSKGERYVHRAVLEVILAKYPRRLPALYREILDHAKLDSELVADAVLRSPMADREKITLFISAARCEEYSHRLPALRALLKLDREQFNRILLLAIESLPHDMSGTYGHCPEAALAGLVNEADDPRVWQALEKAARHATVGLRMEILDQLCDQEDSRHPSRRLSLLSRFLEDTEVRDTHWGNMPRKIYEFCVASEYTHIEVRSFAALKMAQMLGINVLLVRDRTPEAWAQLRGKVRQAYERELAGGERKKGHK